MQHNSPRVSRPMLLILLTLCLAAPVASAQDLSGATLATLKQACSADVQTVCPNVQPGGGRIKACFKQNFAKLSDGCKKALMNARAAKRNGAGG